MERYQPTQRRRIRLAFLLAGLGLFPRSGISEEPHLTDEPRIQEIFLQAKNKETAALKRYYDAMGHSESLNRFAAATGLLLLDERFSKEFLESFPTQDSLVMHGVYEQIEMATAPDGSRLTPTFLFTFDRLGELAGRGDPVAVSKLLDVTVSSDGVVSELLCERVVGLFTRRTSMVIDSLGKRDAGFRDEVYQCFRLASNSDAASAVAALRGVETRGDQALVNEAIAAIEKGDE